MRRTLPASPLVLPLFLCLLASGCGFDKGSEASRLNGSSDKNIVIPLFANATFESNLEKELTRIFKTVFSRDGWGVEDHTAGDGLILAGKITHFTQRPTALTPTGGARAYQIKIDVEVRLLAGAGQAEIFVKSVSGISDYLARTEAAADRAAKDRAIREAGEEMAEQVSVLIQQPILKQPLMTME